MPTRRWCVFNHFDLFSSRRSSAAPGLGPDRLLATGVIVYATMTSEVGYTAAFLPRTFVNVFVKYLP